MTASVLRRKSVFRDFIGPGFSCQPWDPDHPIDDLSWSLRVAVGTILGPNKAKKRWSCFWDVPSEDCKEQQKLHWRECASNIAVGQALEAIGDPQAEPAMCAKRVAYCTDAVGPRNKWTLEAIENLAKFSWIFMGGAKRPRPCARVCRLRKRILRIQSPKRNDGLGGGRVTWAL